ncbi:MAG: hypothetical protein JWO02_3699 [Solirubrobacterales bacterium]|nr:hypothetical protein [Solirubrobacterales bacterium]
MQIMNDPPLAPHSAFDAFYGLRAVRCDDDGAFGELVVQPHHPQPTQVVRGGVDISDDTGRLCASGRVSLALRPHPVAEAAA